MTTVLLSVPEEARGRWWLMVRTALMIMTTVTITSHGCAPLAR